MCMHMHTILGMTSLTLFEVMGAGMLVHSGMALTQTLGTSLIMLVLLQDGKNVLSAREFVTTTCLLLCGYVGALKCSCDFILYARV